MSDAPTYRIRTIEDFDAVPDERIEDCLADFGSYVAFRRLSRLLVDEGVAKPTEYFTWIDDGERGLSEVRLVDDEGNLLVTVPTRRTTPDSPPPAAAHTGGDEP